MVENHAKSIVIVCSIWECLLGRVMIVHVGCLVNGVCMYGLAVVLAFWSTTGIY